jgi:carboxymethylenebutenolidase
VQTRIFSSEGGTFDCYVGTPAHDTAAPAVVLASAIHGVDRDLREIAEEFVTHGFIAAAPDLFWRTVPGPLPHGDARAACRAQPRHQMIRTGERDLCDVLAHLDRIPTFNGRAMVLGFCYGGPYAILGPLRLGFDAGMACHGSQMLDYIGELEASDRSVCVAWGDEDHLAPVDVRSAFLSLQTRTRNLDVQVFPGVRHGYMMKSREDAFDPQAFGWALHKALGILATLTGGGQALTSR